MFVERLSEISLSEPLESRIIRTLQIADRWGYGLRAEDLARMLYGGGEEADRVRRAATTSPGVAEFAGFYVLRGRADLARKSATRTVSNDALQSWYEHLAETFAADLLRHAPFVRSVCVSGSLASGGLAGGDDVDFDVVTGSGTKYLVYLVGLALGILYSLRWGKRVHGNRLTSRFAKVTCMNVIWEEQETRPFDRRDEFLAFELLRARVLFGATQWSDVLRKNEWLGGHFPQLLAAPQVDRISLLSTSPLGYLLAGVARRQRSRLLANKIARWVTWVPFALVQFSRRRDPAAATRQRFLRFVKFPYEFFQD